MNLQLHTHFNIFDVEGRKEISPELVDSELARAERRLENWENKSYYQKVASLAKIADMLPNQTDQLSILIKAEIDSLLAQSYRDIVLL